MVSRSIADLFCFLLVNIENTEISDFIFCEVDCWYWFDVMEKSNPCIVHHYGTYIIHTWKATVDHTRVMDGANFVLRIIFHFSASQCDSFTLTHSLMRQFMISRWRGIEDPLPLKMMIALRPKTMHSLPWAGKRRKASSVLRPLNAPYYRSVRRRQLPLQ